VGHLGYARTIAQSNYIWQKLGITKSFITEADIPALKLTFIVTGISQEENTQEGPDEVRGKLELELRRGHTHAKDM